MRVSRTRKRRRSGAAAIELAFMMPIFCTLVFAQLETARLGMVTQMMTIAAREGARVAVMPKTLNASAVQTRVSAVLANTGIPVGTMTITPSSWATDVGGTAITVSLSLPYSQASWLPTPMYFGSTILNASATLNSERP